MIKQKKGKWILAGVVILVLLMLVPAAYPQPLEPVVEEVPWIEILSGPQPGLTFGIGEPGPTGPIFSGPQQQPFLIKTEESGLGPPLVDNYEGIGMPVRDEDGNIIGFSQWGKILTRVDYFYMSTEGKFKPLPDRAKRPADLAQTTTTAGLTVDYIVRVERGTINRFIYGIAMLAPISGVPDGPGMGGAWNRRLVYHFVGGVGIGNSQGVFEPGRVLLDAFLSRGYAVAHSTGNATTIHYNPVIHGETMMMVKNHFVARHGQPLFTVGKGGSGGAIQQLLIAQNHPGLLDGIIPAASYPDMITQMIHVGDGMLMEYYMNVRYPDFPVEGRWASFDDREVFHGLPGCDEIGSSAFMVAWGGLPQLVLNPHFQKPCLHKRLVEEFGEEVVAETHFTHAEDLRNIYGIDEDGWARCIWDNVGVQYGLLSLQEGKITTEEFLHFNERIGGWKHASEMVGVSFPYDHENMQPERTAGCLEAIRAAYRSGMVFIGNVDIPIIDIRRYLEPVLDMHHFRESFTTRERIKLAQGHADNHIIWVVHPDYPYYGTIWKKAYEVMAEWLMNIRKNPHKTVVENRPEEAVDTAWDADGNIFDRGPEIWQPGSPAWEAFPPYKTSRMLAGAPTHGLMFKAQLMSVDEAIRRGYYPDDFTEEDFDRLREIFPDGVADFTKPGAGMPPEIYEFWFRN